MNDELRANEITQRKEELACLTKWKRKLRLMGKR
jgi:hypothetical protein